MASRRAQGRSKTEILKFCNFNLKYHNIEDNFLQLLWLPHFIKWATKKEIASNTGQTKTYDFKKIRPLPPVVNESKRIPVKGPIILKKLQMYNKSLPKLKSSSSEQNVSSTGFDSSDSDLDETWWNKGLQTTLITSMDALRFLSIQGDSTYQRKRL